MLVVSRRPRQRIAIQAGKHLIWVELVEIQQGKVRLGIDAGKDVQVDREEVYESKRAGGEPCPKNEA